MHANNKLNKSILVIAHPDDEILWFSSLLRRVDHVVFCFSDEMADPAFGARRKKTVMDYPLKNTSSLNLTSMGFRRPQSFVEPRFNQFGIELVGNDSMYFAHKKKYRENYYELREKLADVLSQYRTVITHNPWGEYGHEEHVQVYRVICELQEKKGYDIWYSGYCSSMTIGLIDQNACVEESMTLQADVDTAGGLMEMYERNRVWTWYKDWRWPTQESFFKQGLSTSYDRNNGKLVTLNFIVLPPVSREVSGWRSRVFRILRKPAEMLRKGSKRNRC